MAQDDVLSGIGDFIKAVVNFLTIAATVMASAAAVAFAYFGYRVFRSFTLNHHPLQESLLCEGD